MNGCQRNEIERGKILADTNRDFSFLLTQLASGRAITVAATGTSMRGRIEPGQRVTISPVDPSEVRADDIVLVRWKKGRFITHLVKKIDGNRFLIGNTWGKINGWVSHEDILGKVTHVSSP